MSYARYGEDSQCYVIGTSTHFECLGCRITGEVFPDGKRYGQFLTKKAADMVAHLEEHREQGWVVPQYAIDRLKTEVDFLND